MKRWLLAAVLTVALICSCAGPAQAQEETYCQYIGIAETIFEYLPAAAAYFDVDLGDAGTFIAANGANFVSGLRNAAMKKDSGAVRDYLKANGLHLIAASLDADDWRRIWTECDAVSPVITSVFYRKVDGNPEGWLVRTAVYLYERGDITELTPGAVVALLPRLELTEYEQDMAIIWLAEEIAAARNLRRAVD